MHIIIILVMNLSHTDTHTGRRRHEGFERRAPIMLFCELLTCLKVDDSVGREYIQRQQPTTRTSKTASILRNRWKEELYLCSE